MYESQHSTLHVSSYWQSWSKPQRSAVVLRSHRQTDRHRHKVHLFSHCDTRGWDAGEWLRFLGYDAVRSSRSTLRIFVKFDVENFYESLSRNSKFEWVPSTLQFCWLCIPLTILSSPICHYMTFPFCFLCVLPCVDVGLITTHSSIHNSLLASSIKNFLPVTTIWNFIPQQFLHHFNML